MISERVAAFCDVVCAEQENEMAIWEIVPFAQMGISGNRFPNRFPFRQIGAHYALLHRARAHPPRVYIDYNVVYIGVAACAVPTSR